MAQDTDLQSTIYSEMATIAREQKKMLKPLSNDLRLAESGLDSLCLAILVARLEDKLGLDPFAVSDNAEFPTTLGEFVDYYRDAAT
jgi:acyl carrier protein